VLRVDIAADGAIGISEILVSVITLSTMGWVVISAY